MGVLDMSEIEIELKDDGRVVGKTSYLIIVDGQKYAAGYINRWVRDENGVTIKRRNIEIIHEIKRLYSFLWE